MNGRTLRWAAASGAALTLGLGSGVAWAAPQGRIQQVEIEGSTVTYLLTAEGLGEGESIDPASVTTTIGGVPAPTTATATATATAEDAPAVTRTTMLVLDSSGSMAEGGKLAKAQDAAKQYLATLPADVRAGLVTFADTAAVEVRPTEDRAAVAKAIDDLQAQGATALNDAVVLTVETLGAEGSRNAVLLSDGKDEGSDTSARAAAATLKGSGVVLDAVSLGAGVQKAQLTAYAKAGNGSVVTATDAGELNAAFESAARSVSSQLAVTATIPAGVEAGTAELQSSALVGDVPITDSAVAVLASDAEAVTEASGSEYGPVAVSQSEASVFDRPWFMPLTLAALFVALASIAALVIGALNTQHRTQGRVQRRLADVSVAGAALGPKPVVAETVLGESSAVRRAVSFADKVAATRDTTWLARKLDEANVALRPGEWAVVHMLIAVLAGLLATLLSDFSLLVTGLVVLAAVIIPWLYLGYRADKRRAEFYAALPDSLQMLAGSLSAGYSLPQALDNVAKETGGTMGQEINRALMESRLGLPTDEALEAVAQRMDSQDFHWTVMAIRINRQVGGNLAEVLTNVAKTVRERERLRRQVKALSAEGVLSGWILALLPLGVALFVGWRSPEYLEPLVTTLIGWVMLAIGFVLYVIGVIWMRNLVRMEV